MFYVYVLKSLLYGNRYVGSTNNVQKRIFEHNAGECRYTSGCRPWRLIYFERCSNRAEAMSREKFLKSGHGRRFLDDMGL